MGANIVASAAIYRAPQRGSAKALLFGTLLAVATGAPATPQDSEFLVVKLGESQTIREVAQKYLGDPDLWSEILRASGLRSITELRPGAALRVPATAVSTANKALLDARGQIQEANFAGAQIFAQENIGKAISLHDDALGRRVKRDWGGTRKLATESFSEATVALKKSLNARDRAAEALVTDRHGQVEGQRPQDLGWRGLQLQSTLIEEEKVRTLSDSTAQITFRDASRLRLSANSNALIERLRYDPLKRSEESKVSLVEGDFYALLASTSSRAKFNVDVPKVNASIDTGSFWVRQDDAGAKFTNYDEGAVRVSAAGKTVTLGKNEGTVVEAGAVPHDKFAVLTAPNLAAPVNESIVYNRPPLLTWNPVDRATGYWIEIASDQAFSRMTVSKFGIEEAQFATEALRPGHHYWRVAALDSMGLPGARSETWRFTIMIDNDPPYLTIRSPERNSILRDASVRVTGEAERGAAVTVQGRTATIAADGRFEATVAAKVGANAVVVVATDPAGNETKGVRTITYMPDQHSIIVFDPEIPNLGPKHFLTSEGTISIRGTSTANSKIRIGGGDRIVASTVSDAQGRFRINVPLGADKNRLEIAVIAPSGFETKEPFDVTVDRTAPEIVLDEPLPRLTTTLRQVLKGRTKPGAKLILNGSDIENHNGRFDTAIDLKDGANLLEFTASDAAGNVSVEKWTVTLDREPPALLDARVSPLPGSERAILAIEVAAKDMSGLAKVAPFKVSAGGEMLTGYLRYNRAARNYQGTLVVPASVLQTATLSEVRLEDDAGNKRTYEIR